MISKFIIPKMDQIDLDQKGYRKVILRSLTKVATQAETFGNKKVRETYNLKRADVDKAISVTPASVSKLQVDIRVKGQRLPLFTLNAKQFGKGVKVTIKKGGRTLLPHAFVATMKSGHTGVFLRSKDKFMQNRLRKFVHGPVQQSKRQAIEEKFTISVPEMFRSKVIIDGIESLIVDKFPGILENQLQFYLSGGN